MVELETRTILTVIGSISHWKSCVDDLSVFIKNRWVGLVLAQLNSFHRNKQSTYEFGNQNKLSFLDILLMWRETEIESTVYRKITSNDNLVKLGFICTGHLEKGIAKNAAQQNLESTFHRLSF